RADRQCGPAEPGQRDRLRVVLIGRAVLAQAGAERNRDVVEFDLTQRGGPQAHAAVGLDAQALRRRLDDEQRRLAVELRGDDEQFGIRGGRDQRLNTGQTVAARRADRGGLEFGRVEQGVWFGDHDAGLRDVVAGVLL